MFLSELKPDEGGYINEIKVSESEKRLLTSLGFNPGVYISAEVRAKAGNTVIYNALGTKVALRYETAKRISVTKEKPTIKLQSEKFDSFFIKESSFIKTESLNIALVGNQNCGKSTLFNLITGADQHIGNFPGVTVEKKTARLKSKKYITVTDLPGIYSLSPITTEERVTRDFILREKPNGIINIIDASHLNRGLNLTFQLLKLEIPVVIALNMMDEVKKAGITIDIKKLEEMLKVPVIPISASKSEGIDMLISSSDYTFKNNIHHKYISHFAGSEKNAALNSCLKEIENILIFSKTALRVPPVFAAEKILEDKTDFFGLDSEEIKHCKELINSVKSYYKKDGCDIIAEKRYEFSSFLIFKAVKNPDNIKNKSKIIDKILCGKYSSFIIFFIIMALIMLVTFGSLGPILQNLLLNATDKLSTELIGLLANLKVNMQLISLISGGILQGISAVLSFIPMILLLLFFLTLLEDSGYLARIAFIFDGITKKVNLSGKSVVPLLTGFGCSVPAILAVRTLQGENERKTTAGLIPFMSCSAKLPVFIYLCSILNCKSKVLIISALYLTGIMLAFAVAAVKSKSEGIKKTSSFILEIPKYRMPRFKNVIKLLFHKTKDFIIRTFTVIFIMSILFWFLKSYDLSLTPCLPENSILSYISGLISPIFAPIGLNDWRITASLFAGFAAKENLVSTLEILDFKSGALDLYTIAPLMIFCLLYTPCMAAIAAQRKEFGIKSAFFTILFQCAVAYISALILRTILIIFT